MPNQAPLNKNQATYSELDQAYEINQQVNQLQEKLKKHKENIRNIALSCDRDEESKKVVVFGGKRQAEVLLCYDAAEFNGSLGAADARRLQALVGGDVISVKQKPVMLANVTLADVKKKLGPLYNELFVDDLDVKINSDKFGEWCRQRRGNKTAHDDEALNFVEKSIKRSATTPRVTFLT